MPRCRCFCLLFCYRYFSRILASTQKFSGLALDPRFGKRFCESRPAFFWGFLLLLFLTVFSTEFIYYVLSKLFCLLIVFLYLSFYFCFFVFCPLLLYSSFFFALSWWLVFVTYLILTCLAFSCLILTCLAVFLSCPPSLSHFAFCCLLCLCFPVLFFSISRLVFSRPPVSCLVCPTLSYVVLFMS